MDAVLGIKGDGFVMIASFSTLSMNGLSMNLGASKLHRLTNHSIMSIVGESSEIFSNKILRRLAGFKIFNGYSLSNHGALHYTRSQLFHFKQKHPQSMVSVLIAGYGSGPELYFLDSENGTAAPIPYVGVGPSVKYCDKVLKDLYKPNLERQAAYDVLKKSANEIQYRCPDEMPNFEVYAIDKDGINSLDTINYARCEHTNVEK